MSVALLLLALPLLAAAVLWLALPAIFRSASESSVDRPVVFERDRAELEDLVRWVDVEADCDEYYVHTPDRFAHLSYDGLVSCGDDEVFIPQWARIVDDAGGFWYSPNGSPEGFDMWGMLCRDPVDLGGGWWECGMGN